MMWRFGARGGEGVESDFFLFQGHRLLYQHSRSKAVAWQAQY